ncbi:MAG: DUF4113 domain-containing protein [Rugosibacter sp.]|jgi:DNA polymerase V|nr:DUF4113 domain-containing protein [Rugosibacter sp.]
MWPSYFSTFISGKNSTASQMPTASGDGGYIRTSPFKPNDPFYSNGLTIPLSSPTDDSRRLVQVVLWGLREIYKPNYNYAKAGVMLSELVPAKGVQTDLFSQMQSTLKFDELMATMDKINRKMGKESIKLASEGFRRPWKMRQENKSPSYMTRWEDVPSTR